MREGRLLGAPVAWSISGAKLGRVAINHTIVLARGPTIRQITNMTNAKKFHVYAIDGFESAHSTEAAAVRAAKRGVKNRRVLYTVVKCGANGLTGGGNGAVVWSSAGTVAS